MRTLLKSLIVVVAGLSLPSCTTYVHEGHRAHWSAPPCEGETSRFGVIGISIERAGESGRGPLVVANVLPDSPADAADIRPGDRIRAIDGESTRGMTIAEAARLIRGPAHGAVELRIESARDTRLVTLVRVPAHTIWRGHARRYGQRRPCADCPYGRPCPDCPQGCPCPDCPRGDACAECPYRMQAVPPEEAPPPAADESLAPELWPPTKPGHHAP